MAKNINLLRLNIQRDNLKEINFNNLTILHNPYENLLTVMIFYEFLNNFLIKTITKLKESSKSVKKISENKSENSLISSYLNKKEIFGLICKIFNYSFSIDNVREAGWTKEILNDILDFVMESHNPAKKFKIQQKGLRSSEKV